MDKTFTLLDAVEAANAGSAFAPISSLSIYRKVVREGDQYQRLLAAAREETQVVREIESRLAGILSSVEKSDDVRRSPYDFAASIYLMILDDVAKDFSLPAAAKTIEEPRLWWAHQVARLITADAYSRVITVVGLTNVSENILRTEHAATVAASIVSTFDAIRDEIVFAMLHGRKRVVSAKSILVIPVADADEIDVDLAASEIAL